MSTTQITIIVWTNKIVALVVLITKEDVMHDDFMSTTQIRLEFGPKFRSARRTQN